MNRKTLPAIVNKSRQRMQRFFGLILLLILKKKLNKFLNVSPPPGATKIFIPDF